MPSRRTTPWSRKARWTGTWLVGVGYGEVVEADEADAASDQFLGCFDGEGGEIGYVVGFVEQFGVAGLEEDFGVALEGDGFDVFAGDVAVGVDFVDEGGGR